MDFHFTPAQDAFRQELRTWLAANVPQDPGRLRHLQPQASAADLAFLKDLAAHSLCRRLDRDFLAQRVWRARRFSDRTDDFR